MSQKRVDSVQIRSRQTGGGFKEPSVELSIKFNNKFSKTRGQKIRERFLTVFCSVCIIFFGVASLTHATPASVVTSIGENISTNSLSLTGAITSGSWLGDIIDIAHGGTGQNWLTVIKGSIPFFSDTGTMSTLNPGNAGQVLTSGGADANPSWSTATRSATFVIAASNSAATSRQQADYVCDGTDDNVEIQAAIDALPAEGGTIVMREGVYSISAYIAIPSNITLLGYGRAKIVDAVYIGELLDILNATNVTVDGIHVNVTKTSGGATNGFGIYIDNSNNITIKNSNIEGTSNLTPTWGVAGKNSNYITFDSNYVSGTQYEALSFWWNVNHSIVSNNIMVENGFGMVIERESSYNTLVGNTITDSKLTTADILIRNAHHNSITGNTVKNDYSLTNKSGVVLENFSHDNVISGNTLTGLYSSVMVTQGSQENTVANNGIFGKTNMGIQVLSYNNQVTGNTINYTVTSGIYLYHSTSNNISNNKLVGNMGTNGNAAIHIDGSSNNTIRGNDISFATIYGIRSVGVSENNIIENNTISDDYSSVAATLGANANSGETSITVSANPCSLAIGQKINIDTEVLTITGYSNPSATPDAQYPRTFTVTPALAGNHSSGTQITGKNAMLDGIVMLDGSVANNIIRNNVIRNASTHSIYYDQSKGAVAFSNNIGYATESSGTSTVTTGATSIAVTHGLAATPTRVQLTPTTATGVDYWISDKTATTFTINLSAAAASDVSFDWRAVVGEGN